MAGREFVVFGEEFEDDQIRSRLDQKQSLRFIHDT
jgi:hypothetical protein